MNLGSFCVCLAVKDIHVSKAFYEKLGFAQVSGDITKNWVVLMNGGHKVGLFQGMFEKNMLTFNPGWDGNAQKLAQFTDVREIQRALKDQGLALTVEADPTTTGPAFLLLSDPDGNPVMLDQHV